MILPCCVRLPMTLPWIERVSIHKTKTFGICSHGTYYMCYWKMTCKVINQFVTHIFTSYMLGSSRYWKYANISKIQPDYFITYSRGLSSSQWSNPGASPSFPQWSISPHCIHHLALHIWFQKPFFWVSKTNLSKILELVEKECISFPQWSISPNCIHHSIGSSYLILKSFFICHSLW